MADLSKSAMNGDVCEDEVNKLRASATDFDWLGEHSRVVGDTKVRLLST